MENGNGFAGNQPLAAFLLVAAASLGAGVAAAYFSVTALAVGLGLVGALLLVREPFHGLLLLALTVPVENLAMFTEGVTISRVVGLALAGGWFAGKILRDESFGRLLSTPAMWVSGLFLALVLTSFTWAQNTAVVQRGFVQLAQLVALAAITLDVIDSWAKVRMMIRALVCSATVAGGLTLYEATVSTINRAGSQVTSGVNSTAAILVTVMPLAFYLLMTERRFIWRFVGAAFIAVGSGAVVFTLSRWSMVLLPLVMLVMIAQAVRSRRARIWLAAGLAGVVLAVGSQEHRFDRLEGRLRTVLPYLTQTVSPAELGTLSPRGYHLAVGMAILRDHPVVGVGYNNYGHFFRYQYQYVVPGADRLYLSHRDAHSSIVGILADLGVLGGLLWLTLLAMVVWSAWRIFRSWKGRNASRAQAGFALFVAVGLQALPYALYDANQTSKLLWLLIGLSLGAWALSQEQLKARLDRWEPSRGLRDTVRQDVGPVSDGVWTTPAARLAADGSSWQ